MTDPLEDQAAYAAAERLLGVPLVLPLGPGEPAIGNDFKRLATRHAFGTRWNDVQAPTIYRLFGHKQGLLDAVATRGFTTYLNVKSAPETHRGPGRRPAHRLFNPR